MVAHSDFCFIFSQFTRLLGKATSNSFIGILIINGNGNGNENENGNENGNEKS
jgi:hypothetical protein